MGPILDIPLITSPTWSFSKIGLPPVIIHFRLGFPWNQPSSDKGAPPWLWKPPTFSAAFRGGAKLLCYLWVGRRSAKIGTHHGWDNPRELLMWIHNVETWNPWMKHKLTLFHKIISCFTLAIMVDDITNADFHDNFDDKTWIHYESWE